MKTLVYFGYIGDEETDDRTINDRLSFMERQLNWIDFHINRYEIDCKLVMTYTAPAAIDSKIDKLAARYHFSVFQQGLDDPLSERRHNRFEMPGFVALEALSRAADDSDLFFYCHSKGIFDLNELKMGVFRLHTSICLLADLDKLASNPAVDRAGLMPSKKGWIWNNFFWVKASVIKGVIVERSEDRYYYEAFIAGRENDLGHTKVLKLIDRVPGGLTDLPERMYYESHQTVSPQLIRAYEHMSKF